MLNRLRAFSLLNVLPQSPSRLLVRRLILPITLVGVIGLGALVPLLAQRFSLTLTLAAVGVAAALPLGVAALQFILNRRHLIPMVILATAAFTPIALPTGTGSTLVDSLLVTVVFAALWVLYMMLTRRNELVPSSFNLPFFVFAGLTLWSIGWSTAFRDVMVWAPRTFIIVQTASGVVNIMLPGAALLVNNFIHDVRWLKWLTAIMLAAGAIGLIKRYDLINLPVNIDGLFNMWVMALAGALGLYAATLGLWGRAAMLALMGAYVFWGLILHISWLAGWLPGIFALGLLVWMRSKKLAVLMAIVVLAVVAYKWDFVQEAFASEDSESGGTRLAAWAANWSITKDHLLFGTGPAGYAAYYMSYFADNAMATHSNYVDMLAQNGLFGFAAVLAMFGQLAWTSHTVRQRVRGRGDFVEALANAVFAGTMACILAMGFGDWLFPFAYTQTIAGFDYVVYSWLFMGTALVLERLTRPAESSTALVHA